CLYLLMILSFYTCKDKEDPVPTTLPEATQSGNNTLGFMLNGELWVARTRGPVLPLTCSYEQKELKIEARLIAGERWDYFTIEAGDIDKEGVYVYRDSSRVIGWWKGSYISVTGDGRDACIYGMSPDGTGTLEITKMDTVNRIIAGRFELKQASFPMMYCGDITITEGRFDVRYDTR
ncbi:MAG: hypothetical protein AAF734_06895, partial [Bacteroidota bacterium]